MTDFVKRTFPAIGFGAALTVAVSLGSGGAQAATGSGEYRTIETQSCPSLTGYYPATAMREGRQGRVQVRITVAANGSVISVEIASSSGFPDLDNAALSMARKCTFVLSPAGSASEPAVAILPVTFRLG